ncbi:polynucleotide 5'-hydroxyl-kinase NOL9 [Nasonia vitripennis]|uniref:Polynucleotide 5'-hydroxyl-kinase NOL9 n=1 Tax=Nasonia vitripennis TaxID=7425 RepID=A0A7M7PWM7_NASVI|nr:polynucleotide 5'-hydroxyl-kinase NOL9 [Nasonia vitripennis]XP_031777729.1 polynucleotide 5'-hydroxyl-kinase NOL9 [Nasonia vitripennis]
MIDKEEKRKRKHSSKDIQEEIHRREKRKRKHKSKNKPEENTPDNDPNKYLAYVAKSKKKSKKEMLPTWEVSTSSADSLLEKKAKKKKKIDIDKADDESDSLVTEPFKQKTNAVIWAKPALNKNAIPLIKVADTAGYLKTKTKMKSKKEKGFKGKVEVRGDVELITPVKSLGFEVEDVVPIDLPPVDYELVDVGDEIKRCTPMIIEATLKKSTKSYLPKFLQSDSDSEVESSKSTKSIKKKNEAVQVSIESSSTNGEQKKSTEQESNCDIPKALQEFYNEVTRAFEATADKSAKADKSHDKQETALTVDNSVKDLNNLKKIVHKSTAYLDSTSPMHQGDTAQFFSLENKVILVLKSEARFSFLGKLKIRVLYGAIELYGSLFEPQNTSKPIEVFSPRGYSSVSVSTFNLDGTHDKEALWDALISEGVERSLKTKLHNTIQECQPGWSVLLLENFDNTLTNFLNSHCSFKLFPRIENAKYPWCDSRRAECVLQANFQFYNAGNEISISPQWNENVTRELLVQWNTRKSLCAILCGGKGVGKSTTARYLINNLLRSTKKVILLDLDPGQAEMTPAACVSLNVIDEPLLGPNFTHLRKPFYQLYLEDINVSNCITRYFECIKKLVECLKSKKNLTGYPIIVNTMGFCRGIGLDICIFLIKLIDPTNVIQLTSKRPRNNFEFALEKKTINKHKQFSISWDTDKSVFERTCDYQLHCVPSAAEGKRQFDTWNMEPRQQRELVLLSYLSQIIQNADEKCFCSFTSNSINNIVPYTLPFSSVYISLTKSSISPSHILAAMNGNIVALCGIDLDDDSSDTDKESLTYPKVVIKPPPSTCYGYGIVRGIDMKQRCLFVNTPLTESQLQYVNLLSGCLEVPFALLQPAPAEPSTAGPYAADRGELPTSREARRGYFRVEQSKNA